MIICGTASLNNMQVEKVLRNVMPRWVYIMEHAKDFNDMLETYLEVNGRQGLRLSHCNMCIAGETTCFNTSYNDCEQPDVMNRYAMSLYYHAKGIAYIQKNKDVLKAVDDMIYVDQTEEMYGYGHTISILGDAFVNLLKEYVRYLTTFEKELVKKKTEQNKNIDILIKRATEVSPNVENN